MNMNFLKIDSVVVVCATIVAVCGIFAYMNYAVNDRNLMAANIEKAIAAGVNPISVRCSYAKNDDAVCVAYSFSGTTTPNTSRPTK